MSNHVATTTPGEFLHTTITKITTAISAVAVNQRASELLRVFATFFSTMATTGVGDGDVDDAG